MYKFWRACTPGIWEGQKIDNLAWFQITFDLRTDQDIKTNAKLIKMLMHLTSGHATLLQGKFQLPELTSQLDLGCRADSRWALPKIFSLIYILV